MKSVNGKFISLDVNEIAELELKLGRNVIRAEHKKTTQEITRERETKKAQAVKEYMNNQILKEKDNEHHASIDWIYKQDCYESALDLTSVMKVDEKKKYYLEEWMN